MVSYVIGVLFILAVSLPGIIIPLVIPTGTERIEKGADRGES